MNWEIPCALCGWEIPSGSDELFILSEGPEGIREACHKSEYWNLDPPVADWKKLYRVAERNSHEDGDNHLLPLW